MPEKQYSLPANDARESRRIHYAESSAELCRLLRGESGNSREVLEGIIHELESALFAEHGTSIDIGDIIGQTFFKALRFLRENTDGTQIENFRGWLFHIAYNLALDSRRICWSRKMVQAADLGDSVDNSYTPDPAEGLIAEEAQIHRRKLLTICEAAAEDLTPKEREILFLQFIDGMKQEDIARRLGIPLGTVKTTSRRAYQQLLDTLKGPAPIIRGESPKYQVVQKIDTRFVLPKSQNIGTQNLNNTQHPTPRNTQ